MNRAEGVGFGVRGGKGGTAPATGVRATLLADRVRKMQLQLERAAGSKGFSPQRPEQP
jgi:hypothetical protein